jgi:hypothetical protein
MKRSNSSSMLVLGALGALAFTGCATAGPAASGPVWDTDHIVGTMWTELCPGGDPEQTWVAFYDDGTFAYLYPNEPWEYDGDERWAIEGGELVVSWNDAYASTRYALTASSRLAGKSTKNCPNISLEYVGPAPDLDWTEKGEPAPDDGGGDTGEPEAPPI